MIGPQGSSGAAYDAGRLSALLDLTQHLAALQAHEEASVAAFEASSDRPKAAMSECMTRFLVIGEVVEWATRRLNELQRGVQAETVPGAVTNAPTPGSRLEIPM